MLSGLHLTVYSKHISYHVHFQTSTNYVRERGPERLTYLNTLSQEAGLSPFLEVVFLSII